MLRRIVLTLVCALAPLLFGHANAQQASSVTDHNRHGAPIPLDEDGAIGWDVLSDLVVEVETPQPLVTIFHIKFPPRIQALDGEVVRIKGYMYPLEHGERHASFLLAALPPSCPFCLPGSATTLIDIKAADPIRYVLDPVLIEGRLTLLDRDETGLYYRLVEARSVTPGGS
jgi:hypothetical protein